MVVILNGVYWMQARAKLQWWNKLASMPEGRYLYEDGFAQIPGGGVNGNEVMAALHYYYYCSLHVPLSVV